MRPDPKDNNLLVKFYKEAIESPAQSDLVGHPVFVDVDMIEILVPGDQYNVVTTKVTQYYIDRFPDEYKRYKQNDTQEVYGWALKAWPVIQPSQLKTLEYLNIFTVEQLANLTDQQAQKLGMDATGLRAKAKAALEQAAGTAGATAQAAENQKLREEMEAMRNQMQALMEASEKRGPGRPKKETAEA